MIPTGARPYSLPDRLALLLAQGCGSGLAPKAPGTFGSLVGVLWFLLLLWPGRPWFYALGLLASVPLAVWACGRAETMLGHHDPGSVVLDEIVAIPLCFALPLLAASLAPHGPGFPDVPALFRDFPGWFVPAGFLAFRGFDIWKPWPIRQIQRLPGGWGIVADDLLAALWVNVLALPFLA